MNQSHAFFVIPIFTALLIGTSLGNAEGAEPYSGRKGHVEFVFGPQFHGGEIIHFDGGAEVEIDTSVGSSFSFGYNFTDHYTVNIEFSWNYLNFTGERMLSTGAMQTISGVLDTSVTQVNLLYNILEGPITPFVGGGMGVAYIISNIPTDPTSGACWWDPLSGYDCGAYQPTHTSTNFAFNIEGGLRWDISRVLFLRASVNHLWIDLDNTGIPGFTSGKFRVGLNLP